MFERILVPLDGSKVSESILPRVAWLASGINAHLVLLTVADRSKIGSAARPRTMSRVATVQREGRAAGTSTKDYLRGLATHLEARGIVAEPVAVMGDVHEQILAQAQLHKCDLIAMSTHARAGVVRGLLGSVTDAVIRSSGVPVLVSGPKAMDQEVPSEIRKVVVPLDGSPLAETVLPYVVGLALRLSLGVVLARAYALPASAYSYGEAYPPSVDTTAIEEEMHQEAARYLEAVAGRLQTRGITASWTALKGAPAEKLVELSQGMEGHMVAISTHGRSGLGRLLIGSVADRLIRSLDAPVLVVRPSHQMTPGRK